MATRGAEPELHRYQAVEPHMGTRFQIVLYAADETSANMAMRAAFHRVAAIDQALTNYDAASELNQLCRLAPHEQGVVVSEDLWRVLRAADRLSRLSDGAFDVTVGPVTKLWRRARRQKQLPDSSRLQAARELVGYHLITFDQERRAVQLARAGMQLDLGGIAKGYAVDEALGVLARHGLARALVMGGGDVAVAAPPPGQPGWRIRVASLDAQAAPRAALMLDHAAVSTSGDTWQHVEINGVRYSHILDPRTGIGITHRRSVTVVAPTSMQADSLATTVNVMGADSGLPLVEMQANAEAVVYEAGEHGTPRRRASPGFDQLLASE
jgi:thiamine biosynthesis lipoprotein